MTNSTSNGYLDGNGNLDITALNRAGMDLRPHPDHLRQRGRTRRRRA